MSSVATTTPTQSKRPLEDSYDSMTTEQLIATLKERDMTIDARDATIATLSGKRAKVTISPEKAQENATKLRSQIIQEIRKQLKYKSVCETSTAPFAVALNCDEESYRALVGIKDGEKTKGERLKASSFRMTFSKRKSRRISLGAS